MKVALPEWFFEGTPSPEPQAPQEQQQQQQQQQRQQQMLKPVGAAGNKQPSVAKQFGSIGKKLKKNLGKLATRSRCAVQSLPKSSPTSTFAYLNGTRVSFLFPQFGLQLFQASG